MRLVQPSVLIKRRQSKIHFHFLVPIVCLIQAKMNSEMVNGERTLVNHARSTVLLFLLKDGWCFNLPALEEFKILTSLRLGFSMFDVSYEENDHLHS